MTCRRPVLAAALLVLLAGPGRASPPARTPPPARVTPPARATPINAASLVGRWGDNGDCRRDVVFRGDGTFTSYTGGEGIWRLAGDRLTMTGANGSFVRIVRRVAPDRLSITGPDGSGGVSQRC